MGRKSAAQHAQSTGGKAHVKMKADALIGKIYYQCINYLFPYDYFIYFIVITRISRKRRKRI